MQVLIDSANPEPKSFNAAMVHVAQAALTRAGHDVLVSDLYAMAFDPVSDRRNFLRAAGPDYYRQQTEEARASSDIGFVPELEAEMDKLACCDLLVLQFPIWWLGMPTIMKGWIDRIFAVGVAYGGGRWFSKGALASKRTMCSVTVGGPEEAYADGGVYTPVRDIHYPVERGILHFTGFTVIEPFVVYGPNRMTDDQRSQNLARYERQLPNLDTASTYLPMTLHLLERSR